MTNELQKKDEKYEKKINEKLELNEQVNNIENEKEKIKNQETENSKESWIRN